VSGWLADQLPAYLLDDKFFRDFIALFTELAAETRVHSDSLPYLADIDVTPGPMLRFMGQWLAFDQIDPSLPDERQRDLLSRLGSILAWRGTRRGVTELLALLTGDEVEVTVDPTPTARGAKAVTVHVANSAWLTPEQFLQFVANEIPADCTLQLYVDNRELTAAGVRGRHHHDPA
jgi:phage tail-like protein